MRDTIWNDFKTQVLRSGNMLNKLIAINAAVYLVFGLLYVSIALIGEDPSLYSLIENKFGMPASLSRLLFQPWGIITYQFMHAGLFHIFFNMLVFLMAGRIFREFLGDKKLLATYLMGGIAGAVIYVAAYNIFPLFHGQIESTILIGASASIIAVLAAAATLVPEYTVHLILIGPVKLVYVALAFFVISVLSLAGGNAGGEFAHVGGALYGFLYVRGLRSGYDFTGWMVKGFDKIENIGKPKPAVRARYVNERGRQHMASGISQAEIDRILDKISKSGYDSLTTAEKEMLFKASNQK
jgi:membrane associated rhomboid family serine protease